MGGSTYGAADFANLRARSATASTASNYQQVFTSSNIDPTMDPKNMKDRRRESRNSVVNPASTPIILGSDVTGSMGQLAHMFAKEGFEKIIRYVFDRKPISDPHIAFAGIGDVKCDRAPLQISQFEGGIEIYDELLKLWVEGGGGGNGSESYTLPWHLAAFHVEADAFNEGRKGFIFTWGDDGPPPTYTELDLEKVYGNKDEPVVSNQELLARLAPNWNVYHFMVNGSGRHTYMKEAWQELLGERLIVVDDVNTMPEIIVSLMQVQAGVDKNAVIKSWSGNTAVAVQNALSGVSGPLATKSSGDVVRF